MTWKFWKNKTDKIDKTDDDLIGESAYDSVNLVFTQMIYTKFSKNSKKIMLNLLDNNALDYLHHIWRYACTLSDCEFDKDTADEIDIYYHDGGNFPMIIIELPEHDDYDVPYFIGLVFYQGYEDKEFIESEELEWDFFVSNDEEDGCELYRWDSVYENDSEEFDLCHDSDVESFFIAVDKVIDDELSSVVDTESRLSFTEIDNKGNEVKTILDFKKNKVKLDKIEKALDDLKNDVSDIRHELKILSDELIIQEFNKNPLMALQIFATPELYQGLFSALYELACLDINIEPDFSILKQFSFEVYDGIISGPIVLITFPKPKTLNECHCVAIAFTQGIEGQQVIDENLVDFRYFSLEESIDECCLIEWTGEDRANFGGGYIADENEFLVAIQQIVGAN